MSCCRLAFVAAFVLMGPLAAYQALAQKKPEPHAQEPSASAAMLRPEWGPYVQVSTLSPRTQDISHPATGRLTYDEEHTQFVASPLSGRVLQVHVAAGATVAAGDPLVTLASPEATQLWGEAQRAKLAHQTAQKNLARVRLLKKDGAISEREVQAAEAEGVLASSSARSAQDHLLALGLQVEAGGHRATLRAQVAGKVVVRHVAVGQEVRADSQEPLLVVSDLNTLWLVSDIFEQDLSLVAVGAPVRLTVPAYPHKTFTGHVDHISDAVDAQSRTIKVRSTVQNIDHALKPDMFASVMIMQKADGGLFVPSQALIIDGDAPAVLVVDDRQALSVRKVAVGPLVGGHYPVLSGLSRGEHVVTRGAPFVMQNIRG